MHKLKARHVTEAARPQGRVLLMALLIAGVWVIGAALFG